ncbi:hypothetical protein ZOSMA_82G00170 [Zostera marina]|uniref:Histone deacetylase complex subunit SAP30 Sin3 binding domain-containing protein n=1 Tax=Zostera marina TaxID=29655 RepID=A0A0K9NP09_ZOSMR|nr:hypothetical protein ZOSMA_82G00170 [Zostera marina]
MPVLKEENGEEEPIVLPAHTKVLVTGNNRTKSIHIGLQGVVKKAVGLGGWYWLVLTNGDEVKLQRNALSVIEAPTENEENDEFEDDDISSYTTKINSPFRKASSRKLTVDLRKLEMVSLWRYCHHFRLAALMKIQPSKEQLIEVVEKHFTSQQLDEFQVIAEFIQASKRLKQSMQGIQA